MSERLIVQYRSARPFRAAFIFFVGFIVGGEVVAHHVGPAAPTVAEIQANCVSHGMSPKPPPPPHMPFIDGGAH